MNTIIKSKFKSKNEQKVKSVKGRRIAKTKAKGGYTGYESLRKKQISSVILAVCYGVGIMILIMFLFNSIGTAINDDTILGMVLIAAAIIGIVFVSIFLKGIINALSMRRIANLRNYGLYSFFVSIAFLSIIAVKYGNTVISSFIGGGLSAFFFVSAIASLATFGLNRSFKEEL